MSDGATGGTVTRLGEEEENATELPSLLIEGEALVPVPATRAWVLLSLVTSAVTPEDESRLYTCGPVMPVTRFVEREAKATT